jgi:hypothetical protein
MNISTMYTPKKILHLLALITLSSTLFYSCSKKEEGCTDNKATNYDPKAVEDDGSCTYCSEPTNPQCPNYDPCYGIGPVTAQFDAFERLGASASLNKFIITSDKFLNNVIKFEAKELGANYSWTIGTETLNTRSVVRSFTNENLIGQIIPVTLVVEKTPNLSCNPNDDGRDSLTRYFEVLGRCGTLLKDTFVGVWKETPMDTFEVSIRYTKSTQPLARECETVHLWNFNKQNKELIGDGEPKTYHYFYSFGASGAPFPPNNIPYFDIGSPTNSYAIIHSNKETVEFIYEVTYSPNWSISKPHHFIGRKKH